LAPGSTSVSASRRSRVTESIVISSSTQDVSVLCYEKHDKQEPSSIVTRAFQANGPVRTVEIVEALTAATRPEDLADAFA
jgi:hypothetical protein